MLLYFDLVCEVICRLLRMLLFCVYLCVIIWVMLLVLMMRMFFFMMRIKFFVFNCQKFFGSRLFQDRFCLQFVKVNLWIVLMLLLVFWMVIDGIFMLLNQFFLIMVQLVVFWIERWLLGFSLWLNLNLLKILLVRQDLLQIMYLCVFLFGVILVCCWQISRLSMCVLMEEFIIVRFLLLQSVLSMVIFSVVDLVIEVLFGFRQIWMLQVLVKCFSWLVSLLIGQFLLVKWMLLLRFIYFIFVIRWLKFVLILLSIFEK